MGGLALKAISIKWSKAGELLAKTTFLMVICWSLVPALYWQISSKYAAILILLSFIGVLIEGKLRAKKLGNMVISYAAAIVLTYYIWYFVRRSYASPFLYVSNGIIVWYPVVFSRYILAKKDNNYNKLVFLLIVFCMLITGVTTILGQLRYPMASRLLAGGGARSELEVYSRMNIGGYSYVYSSVLVIPYLMYIGFSRKKDYLKLFSILCLFAIPVVAFAVFLSQYYLAIILSTALALTSFLVVIVLKIYTKGVFSIPTAPTMARKVVAVALVWFFLMVFSFASVFILSSNPAQVIMRHLGQSSLVERSTIIDVANFPAYEENKTTPIEESNYEKTVSPTEKPVVLTESTSNESKVTQETNTSENEGATVFDKQDTISNDEIVPGHLANLQQESEIEASESDVVVERVTSKPLRNRLEVYRRPLHSFYKSPWIGNLLSWEVTPSGHSELVDALLCGGVLGAIVYCFLLYLVLKGLFSNIVIGAALYPFFLSSIIVFLGLSAINTITHGKEIILIGFLVPVVLSTIEVKNESSLVM